jgi:cytochrome c-type biogenesis protein CcmH/NrfG
MTLDGPPASDRPGGQGGMPGGAPAADGAAGAPDMAQMEQVQKEIAALRDLLQKEPNNLQALVRMGDMFFDAGMFDKSKEYYQRALTLNPGDIKVETDLGTALRNTGQPQEALKLFERTVAKDPSHWRGWFNIGIVSMYDLRDFDRAEKAFQKVSELKPDAIDMAALKQEIEKEKARPAGGGGT